MLLILCLVLYFSVGFLGAFYIVQCGKRYHKETTIDSGLFWLGLGFTLTGPFALIAALFMMLGADFFGTP